MEKMREEFEAWCSKSGYKINPDGGDFVISALWAAWKQSRAVLCVELPRPWNEQQDDYRRDLVCELELNGISYT